MDIKKLLINYYVFCCIICYISECVWFLDTRDRVVVLIKLLFFTLCCCCCCNCWRIICLSSSGTHHIAYFRVHSRASSLYLSRSVLYILAISGTSGSSGFGSHSREQIDNSTESKKVFKLSNESEYLKVIKGKLV